MTNNSTFLSEYFISQIFTPFSASLKRQSTVSDYLSVVNHICNFLKKDFTDISAADAHAYFLHLQEKKKLTIRTLHTKLGYLRSISTYITNNLDMLNLPGYVNPFLRIDLTDYDQYLDPDNVPSLEMIDKLLTACTDEQDSQMYLIISLVVRCSLSASQICSLKPSMIRLDANDDCFLCFFSHNNEKLMKLPKDIAELLFAHLNIIGQRDYLFYNAHHSPLRTRTLQQKMSSLSEKANLSQKITLQQLRNASIAFMLAGGGQAAEVSSYCNIAPRWLYRFERVLSTDHNEPYQYANFTIAKKEK